MSRLISILVTLLTATAAMMMRLLTPKHRPYRRTELGFFYWLFLAVDAGTVVFWWYSFAIKAPDLPDSGIISIMTWVTLWRHTHSTKHHPVSCALTTRPAWRKPIVWTLSLATAVQWLATCFVLGANWGITFDRDGSIPNYDYLESRIYDAPGASDCAPEQLCAKRWLFSDPTFNRGTIGTSALFSAVVIYLSAFVIFSVWMGMPFLFWLSRRIANALSARRWGPPRSLPGELKRRLFDPMLPTALVMYFFLPYAAYAFVLFVDGGWNSMHGEAVVAYDLQCRAVHVTLSPWKQYLDVDGYGRTVRIVLMWLNA